MAVVIEQSFAVQRKPMRVRDDGVIPNAKIIGNDSLNGRFYSDPVIAEAIARYDGAKVYINHPKGREGALERDFNDWIGVVESPRARKGGGFANIRLRKEHAKYREIVEAVNDFPGKCGFSHVADIDSEFKGSPRREHVNRIGEVFSVDLVGDPATTKGIFEARTMKKTFEQIVESTKRLAKKKSFESLMRRVLEEEIAAGNIDPNAEVEMPSETPTDDEAVKAGLMKQISMALETADAASLKKVLTALGIGDSISELMAGGTPEVNTSAPNADGTATGAGSGGSEPDKEKATESRLARLEAENLLHKLGREANDTQILAVASVPANQRKAVAESFPAKGGKAVTESRRPGESPPARKVNQDDDGEVDPAYESRMKRKLEAARESRNKKTAAR